MNKITWDGNAYLYAYVILNGMTRRNLHGNK